MQQRNINLVGKFGICTTFINARKVRKETSCREISKQQKHVFSVASGKHVTHRFLKEKLSECFDFNEQIIHDVKLKVAQIQISFFKCHCDSSKHSRGRDRIFKYFILMQLTVRIVKRSKIEAYNCKGTVLSEICIPKGLIFIKSCHLVTFKE